MRWMFWLCLPALISLLQGCADTAATTPAESVSVSRSSEALRLDTAGCVIVSFSSNHFGKDAPPDGVRAAVLRATDSERCSAASFVWTETASARRWAQEQLSIRAAAGRPQKLILAGHGTGASTAAETARAVMATRPDVQIVLLLTVDAVKTGRISSTAGYAGNQIANRVGWNVNLVAYDNAPAPDGARLLSHINYYQNESGYYHGAPMPSAENHLVADTSGLLNHGDVDDFVVPLVTADIATAIRRAGL